MGVVTVFCSFLTISGANCRARGGKLETYSSWIWSLYPVRPGFEIAMRSVVEFPRLESQSPMAHRRVRMVMNDDYAVWPCEQVEAATSAVSTWERAKRR